MDLSTLDAGRSAVMSQEPVLGISRLQIAAITPVDEDRLAPRCANCRHLKNSLMLYLDGMRCIAYSAGTSGFVKLTSSAVFQSTSRMLPMPP